MSKGGTSQFFWRRTVLGLLACEAAIMAVTWLLFRQMSWRQHFLFSDVLFLIGVL
jgi:uncharacterized membrane protein